jgi:hypothetical protein
VHGTYNVTVIDANGCVAEASLFYPNDSMIFSFNFNLFLVQFLYNVFNFIRIFGYFDFDFMFSISIIAERQGENRKSGS